MAMFNQHSGSDTVLDAHSEETFCKLIARRTGILLQDHQLSNLRDTVRTACEYFSYKNAAQFLSVLQQSQGLTAPLEYLIAGVTVGESYFFRDNEQIKLLRSELLPDMIVAKRASGDLRLRIWSAGCSQGQEIYSIAILLQELIPDIAQWRIHLLGTDINTASVAAAMRGCYSEWSFRATSPVIRKRWFSKVGSMVEIDPEIRAMVTFGYLNLTADVYPSILSATNAMDVILCRNVFIYLDRESVGRSMAQYADCLLDQGVLMLGASDPMEYKHTTLELVQTTQAGYFRKNYARVAALSQARGDIRMKPASHELTEPLMKAELIKFPDTRAKSVPSDKSAVPEVVRVLPTGEKAEIINLLRCADWSAVLLQVEAACLSGKEDSDLWQMKAKALASLGRMDEAQHACERSLQLNATNKHVYLIQGLILAELERAEEAEEALRRALYLDHSFLEAHYEIGMLNVRARNLKAGVKSMSIALKLAQEGNPERELHNAAGMTYRRFAEVLHNEIEMLRGLATDLPTARVVKKRV